MDKDVRFFRFYDPKDPRPPMFRSLEQCLDVLRERKLTRRVGVELSQLAQICDRMVGEPSLYTQGYFDAFRGVAQQVVDATALIADVRAIKTPQEIERMKLGQRTGCHRMEFAKKEIRPGMKESDVAAMIEGHIHAVGVRLPGQGRDGPGLYIGMVRQGDRNLYGHQPPSDSGE